MESPALAAPIGARSPALGSPIVTRDEINGSGKDISTSPLKSKVEDRGGWVDVFGRPVDKSKTGRWRAAGSLYAIGFGDFQASLGVFVNLVPFLFLSYHQTLPVAANVVNNMIGTGFLLAVLGGFVADSYLGAFYTIVIGGITMILGLGLLTATTTIQSWRPPLCVPRLCTRAEGPACIPNICQPAGQKYLTPLYVALYTMALGSGLERAAMVALGGEQFDESVPAEKKQSVHYFIWFYFFANLGLIVSLTAGTYLQSYVSRGWGYAFALMLYVASYMIFLLGTRRIRNKRPTGSFLTRMFQVFAATLRKWKAPRPEDDDDLYNPARSAKGFALVPHTRNLRFLDRAAIIDDKDRHAHVAGHRPDPWRLCTVTQVEESKRLLLLVPIWASTTILTVIFSQLATYTVQQGRSLDRRIRIRKLGIHFDVPSASLGVVTVITAILTVPIYDGIIVPILRRYTNNPYGLTPLKRMGLSFVFAILTMVTAALVERKRLTYVRELSPAEAGLPLGYFVLPMRLWWLFPQYMLTALVEFFFFVAAYEFYYYENAESTRSVGSSFTYSSAAMGYFISAIIGYTVNKVTYKDPDLSKGQLGGGWLEGQINFGGLEKYYWLLAVLIFIFLLAFLTFAYFYDYKHDWYQLESSPNGPKSTGTDDT